MADPVPTDESNSFTITLDDTSPSISYTPLVDISAAAIATGWTFTPGDDPNGQSGQGPTLHVTEADGASLGVQWNGTGISLYGDFLPLQTVTNTGNAAAYSVTLDGTPTTNYAFSSSSSDISQNVLASFSNLSFAEHNVVLSLHNPSLLYDGSVLLQFDRAVVTSEAPPISATTGHATANSSPIAVTQVLPDDALSFQGQWSFQPNLLPGQDISFHTSNNAGDRALLTFNGTAITVSGFVSLVSGSYNVSIDDEVPVTLSARSSFNASAPTVLYYRMGLDPSVMHHLSVTNAGALEDGDAGSLLALSSVNVTTVEPRGVSPSPSQMSSKLSRGTIAAIAVCASAVLIALVVAISIYIHRRRSSNRRKESFIQNPRLNRLRRFSFMSRGTRSQHGDPEKDHHEYVQEEPRRSEAGVLDITAKSAEDTEDGEVEEVDLNGRPLHRKGRIASQNSDGSFAIELPQLPDRGHVRASASSAELLPPSRDSPPPPSPIVFRTSRPRGPRNMRASLTHGRDGSRGILLSDVEGVRDEAGGLPQIETISPLRVNFQDVPPREDMRQDRPASEGAASIPTSLKIALFGHERSAEASTAAPATPTTPAGDPHLSFLDMESSTSTSIKSSARSARQSASGSTKSSSNPRADNASTYYAILPPPPNRKSLALSMSMGPGPTSSRPSLSPSISLQPIPMSPETIQRPALSIPEDALTSSDKGDERAGQLEFIPSPTDSLPLTVSDIHFRHSSYSTVSQPSESRRASAANRSSGSQRLPHPPLPLGPENKPFIVQKLLGMHGTPPTPYSSPTTPQFGVAGPSHRRAGSAGVVSPMSPGFFIPTRDPTGRTK